MTRLRRAALILACAALVGPDTLLAQARGEQPPPSPFPAFPTRNAQDVRGDLSNLLESYPPALRRVIQLDPTLLDREDYLAPYPELLAFLQQHPEVRRDSTFYFGAPTGRDYEGRRLDDVSGILAGLGFFIGIMVVLGLLASVVQQAMGYRRWLRQSRQQAEVHTKILDRLQSNEDLLAYIQTPSGRHFLESMPIGSTSDGAPMAAPLGRILWSVQAGVVLTALGIGFAILQRNVPEDVAPAFFVLGTVAAALGIGGMVSAAVAYFLSMRLGLLPAPRTQS